MLRIRVVDITTANLIVSENYIVNKVGNSKVNQAKVGAKMAKSKRNDKSEGKNSIKFFWLSPKFLTIDCLFLFPKLGKLLPS